MIPSTSHFPPDSPRGEVYSLAVANVPSVAYLAGMLPRAFEDASVEFRGATVADATGLWIDSRGDSIQEPAAVVILGGVSRDEAERVALQVGRRLKEESVAVWRCGDGFALALCGEGGDR